MQYPELLVIPGDDLKIVEIKLKRNNINYVVINHKIAKKKSKIFIGSYNWPIPGDTKKGVEIETISKGLTLFFFKSERKKLNWDININWFFYNWETDIDFDVDFWFSTNFKLTLTNEEDLIMANIINYRIYWENEILRIYDEVLILTFLHPEIQNLLDSCAYRKKSHVNMWSNVKKKLNLVNVDVIHCSKTRSQAITLNTMIMALTEVIALEEILKPAATECLTYFTAKGHLGQFIKLVHRRDKESQQHAQALKILLIQIEKMYPFLNETIAYFSNVATYCENTYNKRMQITCFNSF